MFRWDRLRHFNKKENWGDPNKMNGALLLLIDEIRDLEDEGFVVHCGYSSGGHSSKSQHYKGNAIDFHIQSKYSFRSQIDKVLTTLKALQVEDRVGLGIYPDWNNQGFHLDLRGTKARWGRIGSEYVSFKKCYTYIKNCEV